MKIKKLETDELFEAALISMYCFHSRVDDLEAFQEKIKAENRDDWGAFDDDGKMMARIVDHRFTFYLDGQEVSTGGIGAVSTLPEYRDRGAVREMFKSLLQEDFRNGKVLSALYPFKHEFYRKQGYEVVTYRNEYTFSPGILAGYRSEGKVLKWNMGEPVADFMSVYNTFARSYNLAMVRKEETMLEHLKVEKPYMDRKFSYLMKIDGNPAAYVIFKDIKHDPAAILQVEECAWTCRDGFYAILAFLARFEADYGEIRLPLPGGIDLLRIIRTPQAYEITKKTAHNFMVRVINAKRLMELISKPADCDFTIRVTDTLIRENNETFRVESNGVRIVDHEIVPDINVSVQALGQLAVGCINMDEAMLRRDVTVNGKENLLRKVFTEKHIFVADHF